ncbi:MAG: hypothetical protein ACREEM_13025 [Blastocatellia bacterium]
MKSPAEMRGRFLEIVKEVSPGTVRDLFLRALEPFNALGRYPVKVGKQVSSLANLCSYGMLNEEWVGPDASADAGALRQALTGWGDASGLRAEWCYEHAINALRNFAGQEIDDETATQAWLAAVKTLREQAGEQSIAPEAAMIWRAGVLIGDGHTVARIKSLPPVEPPDPPPGFPPRAIRFEPPMNRKEYAKAVREAFGIAILDQLKTPVGFWGFLSDDERETFAARMRKWAADCAAAVFKRRREEFDRYCDVYDEHLKRYGWIELSDNREFERHSKWLMNFLGGATQDEIADREPGERPPGKQAVSKAITTLAAHLDLPLPERRGRQKSTFRRGEK